MSENNQSTNNTSINNNNNPNANNRDENINVVVRIRGKKVNETGACSLLNILDDKSIQVDNRIFYYDYVANMNSTQEEMFQHCAKRICDNSLKGYNGTIFAYGQTGSGKTFTLLGQNITKYSEKRVNPNFSFDNTTMEMNYLSQDNDLLNINMNSNNKNMDFGLNRKSENGSNNNIYKYDIMTRVLGYSQELYIIYSKTEQRLKM